MANQELEPEGVFLFAVGLSFLLQCSFLNLFPRSRKFTFAHIHWTLSKYLVKKEGDGD